MLDASELRQLERLSVVHVGAALHELIGRRAGPSGGHGMEFDDYRPYAPGDELRRVDWNIYARLGEAFVKTAPDEAHAGIALLIDGSRSMDEATPTKFRHAQRLAALLGAVALLGSDAVQLQLLSDGRAQTGGTLDDPHSVLALTEELAALPRGVGTDLAASVCAYRDRQIGAEVAVLVSDALVAEDNLREALSELAGSAETATLVHVTSVQERLPEYRGQVQLRDRETGERLLVDMTGALRERYASRFDALADRARTLAAAAGVGYVRAPTDVAPIELLFAAARRGELVVS